LSIVPNSIKVPTADSLDLKFDELGNVITNQLKSDSVLITYQTYPFNLSKKYLHRDEKLYLNRSLTRDNFKLKSNYSTKKEEIFDTKGVNKTGNITRGVSFGNTQNVFVNSSLNLQMEGFITPDVKLTAAISDQNIPVQPDGNTQQIQQFDKIYLQFEHKKGTLIAGDFVLKNKDSYFVKYLKNVQGGQLNTTFKKGNWDYQSSLGASLAKGKFGSVTLEVAEGIQGPYRLTGPNNEKFIIVISNSEKVYLDGKLLARGFNYDYIIDYNSGEITFTANVLLTKYSRVRVDYEYSERNYSRSNIGFNHRQQNKKLTLAIDYYAETDNKNAPLNISLSDIEKTVLASVGDSLQKAFTLSVDSVGFNSNQVLYADTLINGNLAFVYSTNPNKAIYKVNFIDVGNGNGDYTLGVTTANGTVYQYIGPKLGKFAPVKPIPAPTQKRIVALGGSYKLGKTTTIFTENALSTFDKNLYSTLDDNNNQGTATRIGVQKTINLNDTVSKTKVAYLIDYQYINKYFNPIDRFREVDFDRDWSTQNNTTLSTSNNSNANQTNDQILTGKMDILRENANFTYFLSARKKPGETDGFQQKASFKVPFFKKRGVLTGQGFLLNTNNTNWNSTWKRFSISPSFQVFKLKNGYEYSIDQNANTWKNFKDSISTAMNFEQHKFYIQTNDTAKNKFSLEYSQRTDFQPKAGEFKLATFARTLNMNNSIKISKNQQLNMVITYRVLQNKLITNALKPEENTVLGRIDWNADLLKKHLKSELTYTLSNGRQLKRQYIFVPVPTGQGTYIWNDLNSDNVQQINEFFEKIYNDPKGEFIRTLAPTNDYINALTNSFNYRLNISSPKKWKEKTGVKKFISKLSNTSSYLVEQKSTSSALQARFNPLYKIADNELLYKQLAIKSATFFNRTSPHFGIDFIFNHILRKDLLTGGFEQKQNIEYQLNGRINIKKIFNFKINSQASNKATRSDFLMSRNFEIASKQIKPELAWQPTDKFRLTTHYQINIKENVFNTEANEKCNLSEFGLDVRISKVSKSTFSANLKTIKIAYNAATNTQIAYEMLEALRPGQNYTWNANWQQKLSNGLQITFVYEGRKSPTSNTVHIGRMQVSALF